MYWYKDSSAPCNFGDFIGPLIYELKTGRKPLWCSSENLTKFATLYFTVGSILELIKQPDRAVVWGSGIIWRQGNFPRPRRVHSVRGPLSRARLVELGYEAPDVYGDPAILLPRYLGFPKEDARYKLGIVPHYAHLEEVKKSLPVSSEVLLIDVMRPVRDVCRDILRCEFTVSSSLHGIIVSHAFGIKSAWISFSKALYGDGVKFHDYFYSAGIDSPVQHVTTGETLDIQHLVENARASPLPDLSKLENRLVTNCPF